MRNKRNIVLVDFDCPADWKFIDGLVEGSGENWEVRKLVSNMNHSGRFQNFIRYCKYFYLPFTIFLRRNSYAKVIAWQQFFGLILAFYCRLFRVKYVPDIYVMTFIYNRRSSKLGKFYESFVRYCLGYKGIKRVFVYSESEPEYYSSLFGLNKSLFKSIELGIDDVSESFVISDNGRYLTAGRSNRDYDFLLDKWNKDKQLDVVCDTLNKADRDNIRFYTNVRDDAYFRMLSECHLVVISLRDENVSSGQLVILQAMMFKKPVICTFNSTVSNYIDSGINGLIIDKSEEALREALETAEINYELFAENGRAKFERKYSVFQTGISVGKTVKGE